MSLDAGSESLTITQMPTGTLIPYAANARTLSDKQVAQIASSIRQFGFNNPILLDDDNILIAGHGRLLAAQSLGIEAVPVIKLSHLSDAQKRAYILADNRLAEKAGWDQDLLAAELGDLISLDLDFDIETTGFDMGEIDLLLGDAVDEALPDDELIDPLVHPVSKPGDLWRLGHHRLLCGSALSAEDFDYRMCGARARTVFTDPPYNVPVSGHVCGLGKTKHREFAHASGEMNESQFTDFLYTSLHNAASVMMEGGIAYVCMDWRHVGELQAAGSLAFTELKNICVWTKTNGGMGSFYRSAHELVFVFKQGTAPHINNVQLGQNGRYRTNVWSYAGINSFGANRDRLLSIHPTVKPTALVADAILDSSKRGEAVLDLFLGSGTTLLACERTGRRGYGLEIDPAYVDAAILRWQRMTGEHAVLDVTGQTYDELSQRQTDVEATS